MDPPVAAYLGRLVRRARAELGHQLVGAYAAGSVAMDAYRPGRSDIDVALVCSTALSEPAKRRLVERLRHAALPCPARGLELVVYRDDVARSGTAAPGFELELNTGPQMDWRVTWDPADRPESDGLFWYPLDRAVLAARGLALFGPPASAAFRAPADDDVRRLLRAAITWWSDRPGPAAPADAVLAAGRALAWQREGQWLAKDEAAVHLLADGVEPAGVLRAALEALAGGTGPDEAQARAFQGRVLAELDTTTA